MSRYKNKKYWYKEDNKKNIFIYQGSRKQKAVSIRENVGTALEINNSLCITECETKVLSVEEQLKPLKQQIDPLQQTLILANQTTHVYKKWAR